MTSNLLPVFNERNPGAQAKAIAKSYTTKVVFYEPDAIVEGPL
jgi:hypothetical protein